MNKYELFHSYILGNNELMHYGVKGMRWGIVKDKNSYWVSPITHPDKWWNGSSSNLPAVVTSTNKLWNGPSSNLPTVIATTTKKEIPKIKTNKTVKDKVIKAKIVKDKVVKDNIIKDKISKNELIKKEVVKDKIADTNISEVKTFNDLSNAKKVVISVLAVAGTVALSLAVKKVREQNKEERKQKRIEKEKKRIEKKLDKQFIEDIRNGRARIQ